MAPPQQRLVRDRLTWLLYVVYGFYGALINGLGPALSGLRSDLGLSHAEAGFHGSLFAVGMLAAGLWGERVVRSIGRRRTLWAGAIGMTVGTLVLVLGPGLPATLPGALIMGTAGSLMLVLVPAILSDHHGAQRASAFNEANAIASGMAVVVPMLIGLSIATGFGWRPGLLAGAVFAVPVLALFSGSIDIPEPRATARDRSSRLPATYWIYWGTIVLVVSVEFCMIYWTTDFFRDVFGFEPAAASAALTAFLIGMVVGRTSIGRLIVRSSTARLLPLALLLAAASFALFWLAPDPRASIAGVFLTGLGVAGLYPMTLGVAVASAVDTTDLATSRAALASGSAVLGGPLLLAALADALGIRLAFAIVPVLLGLAAAALALARRMEAEVAAPGFEPS